MLRVSPLAFVIALSPQKLPNQRATPVDSAMILISRILFVLTRHCADELSRRKRRRRRGRRRRRRERRKRRRRTFDRSKSAYRSKADLRLKGLSCRRRCCRCRRRFLGSFCLIRSTADTSLSPMFFFIVVVFLVAFSVNLAFYGSSLILPFCLFAVASSMLSLISLSSYVCIFLSWSVSISLAVSCFP